jgi:hypothetical protein
MCEKVEIILMCMYFYMHLSCFGWLAFAIFGVFNFLAILNVHVWAVAMF